jgi:hypothetical protein
MALNDKELYDWSCEKCGNHIGKYGNEEQMEYIDLICFSCNNDEVGIPSYEIAKEAISKLKELGYEYSECKFIKRH